MDDLWNLGEDVRELIRGYERAHPGSTDIVLVPPDEEDSLQEQESAAERETDPFTPEVLAGEWLAVGVDASGEVVEEMLLLRSTPSGCLEGTVTPDAAPLQTTKSRRGGHRYPASAINRSCGVQARQDPRRPHHKDDQL